MADTIKQRITPMLWFDNQAEEAVMFYTDIFPNSNPGRVTRYNKEGHETHGGKEGTVMTIEFEIDGYLLVALNGGPVFKMNPAVSFFVTLESESQVDHVWTKLSEGGMILMAMDKYPWAEKYGWVQDRFGVSWQIALGSKKEVGGQTIVPTLMFVNEHYGQAEAAMNFYTSIFRNSSVTGVLRNGANELPDKEGTVKHAQFILDGQTFMIMDSGHAHQFSFNEGISLVVRCETQKEIDYYWGKLTEGGDPNAQMCGWLKDKFGVSWQVDPVVLFEMLQDPDTRKAERVTKAFLQMKKFSIPELEEAYEG